jgi:hypothetical protein
MSSQKLRIVLEKISIRAMEYLQQNTNFKQILSIIEYTYMLKNINSSNNPITSFSRNVCNGTGEV